MKRLILFCLLLSGLFSCAESTPKPKGYLRLEPEAHQYTLLSEADLPYAFQVSRQAIIELPALGEPDTWLTIFYPKLNVRVYCSYLPITRLTFDGVNSESRMLLLRQARQTAISEVVYTNPESNVFASLFIIEEEEVASPLQFILTGATESALNPPS